MEIVRLPVGKQASVEVDCLRIEEQLGGEYRLTGSAMCVGADDGESVSIVGGPLYASAGEAETAGVAWATSVGVERLHISSGSLEQPLQLLEIDKPL